MALDPKIDAYLARLSSTATPMSLVEMRAATETSLGALHGPLEDVADVRTYLAPGHDGAPCACAPRRAARRRAACAGVCAWRRLVPVLAGTL